MSRLRLLHLFAVAACAVALVSCPSSPPTVPGANATIYRDIYGVPHVAGETEYDALYGMGYAMAQDQLDLMMTLYRTANGRVSAREGLGPGFNNLIGDYLALLFRVPQSAEAAYAAMPPDERLQLDGFAAGVNARVVEHNRTAERDYEFISGQDIAAWGIYIGLGRQLSEVLVELTREVALDFGGDVKNRFEGAGDASNQWAVAPSRTGGPAMLHADPHLVWTGPSQWYEAHIRTAGGALNVTGAAVIGAPLIAMGRNELVAWSLTSNTPSLDFADVYREKLVTRNDLSEYRYDPDFDGKKPIVREDVVIPVRGWPVPLRLPAYYTHHGPVMPLGLEGLGPKFTVDGEHVYSIALCTLEQTPDRYPGTHIGGLLRLFYRMDTARNVRDVQLALGLQGEPDSIPPEDALQLLKWNVMAADTDGNIYYIYNGRCPIRPHFDPDNPAAYQRPVAGWTGLNEWARDPAGHVQYWPIRDLPQALNPDCGYLVNCNAAPQRVCPDSGIDLDDYPAYLVRDHGSDRQVRALQLFADGAPVTEARMRAFGLDVHMVAADVMENHFFAYYDPGADADLAEVAALLASEPNEATADNRSVLLLQEWFLEIGGGPFFFYPEGPAALTPAQVEGMFAALRRARDRLQACAHGLSPRWGDVHVIERGETFPLGGGSGIIGTLFNATGANEPCGPVAASQGSSFLQVSVLDPAGVRSVSLRPLGASSDPASPHYNDETARFAARDPETSYKPSLFVPEAFMGAGLESATDLRGGR